jgi:hypothetical protein
LKLPPVDIHAVNKKLYISGPMTDYKDNNKPAFNKAEHSISKLGYIVVNPARVCNKLSWVEYLIHDIKKLVDCGTMYMLKGWKKSKGATLEHHIAKELDMEIFYE